MCCNCKKGLHLKIKCLTPEVREMYENHGHFHEGDAGLDLFMPKDAMTHCNGVADIIGLGIAIEPNRSYSIVPRSSMAKTPMRLANSVGIIDKGYRGELKAPLDNVRSIYKIEKGQRLLQIVSPDLGPITFELVDELSDTSRGEGGIGSTGK